MGVAITELLSGKEIDIKELKGKKIAIDAFNIIYQFLTTLRGSDGKPLKNSKGEVTAHLKGLLSRNLQFLKEGIFPIYVFDGEAPDLKKRERERRKEIRESNRRLYEVAKERNDFEGMRKYSQRLIHIDEDIIKSSKKLLSFLGIPFVQSPSEGEAQAAHLVKKGDADFVITQDADAILVGAPFVIRNLSVVRRKKKRNKFSTEKIVPKVYSLADTLNQLGIDINQLRVLAMCVGTDYNVGGIKGLGPKKALKIVKEYGTDFELLFQDYEWDKFFDVSWREVKQFLENIPVTDEYKLEWKEVKKKELIEWLVNDKEFTEETLKNSLKILEKIEEEQKQKGLTDFF